MYNTTIFTEQYHSAHGNVIPQNTKVLGQLSFSCDTTLNDICIPDHVSSIQSYCFSHCVLLSSVTFNSKEITSIPRGCFLGCENLSNIVLPEGVTELQDECFFGCKSLKKIVLPSTVVSIGKYSFSECDQLTSIEIPSNVKNLDLLFKDNCFEECPIEEGITPKSSKKEKNKKKGKLCGATCCIV
ncbi:hypothetical protein EIN_278060 [Entamoeba invadens IP1]|uniref:Leucine rich repeat containing protein BspA family protein n=1 Tax=Entamoeba invadens IP1 TaxID=370355 RepID=A0A0A1TVF7_ENTIV|nr:hypothetical protein EIN_278060 [Entamoeba invadens IP1]ELP84346.1 hypothetical protein EIN_278060 [Entamoeba invadens IP1]|eukprot:XP_004183692.1 hypothetical protein EIN_278060 [Entamoeba invadens IP1]